MNLINALELDMISGGNNETEKPTRKDIPDCWIQPPGGWDQPNIGTPPADWCGTKPKQ